MEKRRKVNGAEDLKEDCLEPTDGAVNPSRGNMPAVNNAGVSISTRRATYVMVSWTVNKPCLPAI